MEFSSAKHLLQELMKYPKDSTEAKMVMDIERAQSATLEGEELATVFAKLNINIGQTTKDQYK